MSDIGHIQSHWNSTVYDSILEQYKDSTHWKAQLKSVIDQIQKGEDAAYELSTILDFEDAQNKPTGKKLDWIASLANVTRLTDESDEEFYTRFLSVLGSSSAGTANYVVSTARTLSGTPYNTDGITYEVHYIEEQPATFFVYTPKGTQLLRRQVKQLAPAGVLGVPGAAIKTVSGGKFLVTTSGSRNGQKMLAVAKDSLFESVPILTDDGKLILTEGTEPMYLMTERRV